MTVNGLHVLSGIAEPKDSSSSYIDGTRYDWFPEVMAIGTTFVTMANVTLAKQTMVVQSATMQDRSLTQAMEEFCFADHKIAMASGPRQCGKMTLTEMLLEQRKVNVYRNWDQLAFRREWAQPPSSVVPPAQGKDVPLVVLTRFTLRHDNFRVSKPP